jgi:hypothetical protein
VLSPPPAAVASPKDASNQPPEVAASEPEVAKATDAPPGVDFMKLLLKSFFKK